MEEKNDITRLKEEADIGQVVDALGLQKWKKGSAFFILCPFPDHDDQHPDNCYYKDGWNNVYCNACGRAMNAVDLIMVVTNKTYGEAADFLWELEGRPSWYYADQHSRRKKKNAFTLSRKEAALIGIHYPSMILLPEGLSIDKPDKYNPSYTKDDGYVKCQVYHPQLDDLLTEDQFRAIAKNKALETLNRCKCINQHTSECPELRSGFIEIENICYSILQR